MFFGFFFFCTVRIGLDDEGAFTRGMPMGSFHGAQAVPVGAPDDRRRVPAAPIAAPAARAPTFAGASSGNSSVNPSTDATVMRLSSKDHEVDLLPSSA